ncbi:MAG: 2OG-Fe(II) oxygenase family protein [Pseudomonadales bacterium]
MRFSAQTPRRMIPTLDLNRNTPEQWQIACADCGFFYLTGHELRASLLAEAMQQSRRFFAQPLSVKQQIQRTATNCWGYYDAELTKNQRDWKEILDIGPDIDQGPLAGARTQLPTLDGFAEVMTDLQQRMHDLALEVTRRVLEALQTSVDLSAAFTEHTSFLRINYYPECADPAPADAASGTEQTFGIHHHTDAGAVTMLAQEDVTSLQVLRDDRWQTIPSARDALIVNLGDIVQVWSNDQFRAPLHRVLAQRDRSRISIPYFLNPACDYVYRPLVGADALYQAINWGEFRARRAAGDYADLGAEVQISDYRVNRSRH